VDFRDYYATLGVAKTATDKEIKQAFRKLARKHHPDVNPGDKAAEAKFKEINEAHEVLSDPDKRRKYDELGANWRMYEQAQAQGAGAGSSPFGQWTVNMGGSPGGGGGYRTMTEEEMRDLFGTDNPFSDFFNTFFGGAEPDLGRRPTRGRTRGRKGRDVEQEIQLTLEDAFRGATRRLSIKHDGHARTVDVRIPPGVSDGSRVRISGEGEHGQGGAAAGDLYLRIRLAPHPQFERRGSDLYVKLSVPLTTAVLGGEAEVPTLGDKPVRLRIPPTTQNGQTFRLRGHGMPATARAQAPGDLYAVTDVQLPRTLTSDQRTHFEALARLEGQE
jgi:curved DNA-binding protein